MKVLVEELDNLAMLVGEVLPVVCLDSWEDNTEVLPDSDRDSESVEEEVEVLSLAFLAILDGSGVAMKDESVGFAVLELMVLGIAVASGLGDLLIEKRVKLALEE